MTTQPTPITIQERAKREEALEFILANLRLAGLYPDTANLDLYHQFNCGEIGQNDLYARLDALREHKFASLSILEQQY